MTIDKETLEKWARERLRLATSLRNAAWDDGNSDEFERQRGREELLDEILREVLEVSTI